MNKISNETRIEVLATIDELNQYLLGHVTIDAVIEATHDLHVKLLLTKYIRYNYESKNDWKNDYYRRRSRNANNDRKLRFLHSQVLGGNVDLQASRIETVYEELFGDHACSDYRTIRH
jgi:hypothetical protein